MMVMIDHTKYYESLGCLYRYRRNGFGTVQLASAITVYDFKY